MNQLTIPWIFKEFEQGSYNTAEAVKILYPHYGFRNDCSGKTKDISEL